MTIHPKHREWIEGRGLDPVLAEKLGLETVSRDGRNWLAVPYREGGETINRKYRLTSEKDHRMDTGAPLALWNADCLTDPKVRDGRAPVIITEGEWDAIAAIQVGLEFVVSVPNGAPATETADLDAAKRYDWVDRHAEALRGVKEFVLAIDADAAGRNLQSDLLRLLGRDRCRFVDYPFPCKDLNEVLQEYGPEKLVDCVTTARPFPVKGLYRLADFPERAELPAYSCGVEPIDHLLKIVPGTFTVVTGYANSGKSTLMNAIVGHALRYHFPVCVASFETEVKPILRDGLRMSILGCGKHDLATLDLDDADDILNDRLHLISQCVGDEELEMDLEYFLSRCELAVKRYGVRMIVLDPWNELEHKRARDETETDYIGRAIRAIKRFAKVNGVAFWVIAHPTKPPQGDKAIPGLLSISGSSNWANKADYGLTYHRPDFEENRAIIMVNKVRMGLPGQRGKVEVAFDFRVSRFRLLNDG